ncbi:MAG: hypothetical protein K0S46_1892 [Moraxellaceae bacterium]|jgi:hypothetical protein|nr:hypothetical protein [Moraxellaceae bacterium]
MKPWKLLPSLLLLLSALGLPAAAAEANAPVKRELQLTYRLDGKKPQFILSIEKAEFTSVAALKEHLKTWAPGSELKWAPGCVRLGEEPLLSSAAEMAAFRAFLEERGIAWVLLPSG